MSNVNKLPFTTCDKCGMKFPKGAPWGANHIQPNVAINRCICSEPGCDRCFSHAALGTTAHSGEIRVWVDA